jgi:hypothetical protein
MIPNPQNSLVLLTSFSIDLEENMSIDVLPSA